MYIKLIVLTQKIEYPKKKKPFEGIHTPGSFQP